MKVERKRSYWSIRVRGNFPDVKMNFGLNLSLSLTFYTVKTSFTNMHQSMPDLSFFTSTAGRLIGGEAGRGS